MDESHSEGPGLLGMTFPFAHTTKAGIPTTDYADHTDQSR